MIYKKFKDGLWERHHVEMDSLSEEIEFVQFLRNLYPDIRWVSIRVIK